MKRVLLATACLLVMSSLALAQANTATTHSNAATSKQPRKQRNVRTNGGLQCGNDPILPTDGTTIYDFVDVSGQGTGTNYYLVHLKDGHSYSAEVYDSTDSAISATAQMVLYAPGCGSTLPTTDVANIDPDLSNDFADRISWIQAGDSDAILAVINPDQSNYYVYNVRIVDTTLHNPRWSTFNGFITQYALVNNTEFPITGNLTVYDNTGVVLISRTGISIPAGGENFQTVSTPPNHFGFATFGFVGPAGAITADAYFINGNATVVVPSTFAPRNYQH